VYSRLSNFDTRLRTLFCVVGAEVISALFAFTYLKQHNKFILKGIITMTKKLISFLMAAVLFLMPFAVNTSAYSDIDGYFSDTKLKIETYPLSLVLEPNENGEYDIPVYIQNLKISSVKLNPPSGGAYSTSWSVDYNKYSSISYSLFRITKRPTVEEGDQKIILTQTVSDKSGNTVGTKDYTIVIKHELPIVNVSFNVTDIYGNAVDDAEVWVGTNVKRPTTQYPDDSGAYSLKAGYEYLYSVSADGFDSIENTVFTVDGDGEVNITMLRPGEESILDDAADELFNIAGFGFTMNEFTEDLREPYDEEGFTPWGIDSDYDDVNVCRYIEERLAKKNEDLSAIKVDIVSVKSDYDWRYNDEYWDVQDIEEMPDYYDIISRDGTINYRAVADDRVDEEYGGEVCSVFFKLSIGSQELIIDDYYDVIVPMHIYTRQERLDDLAKEYGSFKAVKGANTDIADITSDLDLSFEYDEAYWYYVVGSWKSDNPSVISDSGKVTPAETDTEVTLTFTVYYSEAQIDMGGFLMDPGPLGDGEATASFKVTVPGTGHSWNQPTWNWNEDNTAARASFVCQYDESHTIFEDAVIASDNTAATCISDGKTVYTAKVTLNGTDYTDSKTVIIIATGHSFSEWEDKGNGLLKRHCSDCGAEEEKHIVPSVSDILESADATVSMDADGMYLFLPSGTDYSSFKKEVAVMGKGNTAATDDKVSFEKDGSKFNFTVIVHGDVNGDGKVTAYDYVLIRLRILGKFTMTEVQQKATDINGNGKVDASDYVAVRLHILKKKVL